MGIRILRNIVRAWVCVLLCRFKTAIFGDILMTNNLWIAHTGGDCPVDTETEVEVMFSGDPTPLKNKAMCFHRKWWAWDELSDESIIAYRIVEQPKADWEKWFDNYRDSRIDGPAVTFEELYQVIAARLKAEGRG